MNSSLTSFSSIESRTREALSAVIIAIVLTSQMGERQPGDLHPDQPEGEQDRQGEGELGEREPAPAILEVAPEAAEAAAPERGAHEHRIGHRGGA